MSEQSSTTQYHTRITFSFQAALNKFFKINNGIANGYKYHLFKPTHTFIRHLKIIQEGSECEQDWAGIGWNGDLHFFWSERRAEPCCLLGLRCSDCGWLWFSIWSQTQSHRTTKESQNSDCLGFILLVVMQLLKTWDSLILFYKINNIVIILQYYFSIFIIPILITMAPCVWMHFFPLISAIPESDESQPSDLVA